MKSPRGHGSLLVPLIGSLSLHAGLLGAVGIGRVYNQSHRESVVTAPVDVTVQAKAKTAASSQESSRSSKNASTARAIEKALSVAPVASMGPKTSLPIENTLASEYAADVKARITAHLQYPLSLRRRGIVGRVGIRLTLSASGQVQAREISERSPSPELDALALQAALDAQPYPAASDWLAGKKSIVLSVPIEFKLR